MTGRTNAGAGSAFAVIDVTYPEGAICTCTNGVRTMQAKDSSGHWMFLIPRAGDWTVSAIRGSKSSTKTVSASESKAYFVALSFELVILDGAETIFNWKYYISGGVSNVYPNSSGLSVGENGYDTWLFTASAIDLTKYKTLTFYMTAATGETTYGVSSSLNQYGYPSSFSAYKKTSSALTQIEVDITNIQSAYVAVSTHYADARTIKKIVAS